ncbi:hypothetical protein HYU17_05655 [Candidatus Woesearchaeota archaeon]|nr:hypothetical protein [Candidatus Woesearchaeota archaeon]
MKLEKTELIAGAKVTVAVETHPSSKAEDLARLVIRGDSGHIMKCMAWFRKRGLDLEHFPDYLFAKLIQAMLASVKSNRRFITSQDMKISIIVNPPKLVDSPFDNPLDALAQYHRELSGPSHAVIGLFADPDLLAKLMQGESVLGRISTHEMQHHAAEGFDKAIAAIRERAKELGNLGRLSYNGWIAIAACLELKNEGMPRFSEYANKGAFALGFSSLEKFVQLFGRIPFLDKESLKEEYKLIKDYAYPAGMTMTATILAQRLALKGIPAYIKPAKEGKWVPLTQLRHIYGVTDLYLGCPSVAKTGNDGQTVNYQRRSSNEAKQLISELQGASHLTFLAAYEAACQYLGVKPLFTMEIYGKVKLQCHINFLNALQKAGLPVDVA